ncbi:CpaF family protein [Candidatus Woesearchaeota archaeon]|nr:CpaF family protein [Candidatus Woesearchaeota archaeon]
MAKDIIEKYQLTADEISTEVHICGQGKKATDYVIKTQEIGIATAALLDKIKSELVTQVQVTASEILDPKTIEELKKRFRLKAEELISLHMPSITGTAKKYFIGRLMQEMLGLDLIEFLLNDIQLEEIVVNSAQEPIRVYHRKYGWLSTNVLIKTEAQIANFSSIIARRVGRQITSLTPLLDAHLVTGDRANAVLYPISTKGNTITLRKFARDPWTMIDFIKNKTCSSDVYALIWEAIEYENNILFSGGTASGKTSFLNTCMPFIPPNHRIVSMEDTRELALPKFLYWCPLVTRQPNPEGKGEVSMLDLLVNSLRMRPDRIILGEIRKRAEAEVLFEAMHTGHSVYATVHADSTNQTIQRLVNPPIEIPSNMLEAVNINIVMFRDRKRGLRRTLQVSEFILGEEEGSSIIKPNILYRWKAVDDTIVQHNESLKLFENLSTHTGMTINEITKEINEKKKILEYMAKKNIRDIDSVGEIISRYYQDKETLLKEIKK